MSGKIKAKDLSYDSTLPPFLQKLHAQKAGNGDSDRHERPLARPRKERDANEDDGPTLVDENGEILSKDEVRGMSKPVDQASADSSSQHDLPAEDRVAAHPSELEPRKLAEKITHGSAVKKRKIAKVIGDNTNTEAAGGSAKEAPGSKHISRGKKAKKVRLAFDDEDPV